MSSGTDAMREQVGRLAPQLCSSLDAGICCEDAARAAAELFPGACRLKLSLLLKQDSIMVATSSLLHGGPFHLSLSPAGASACGAAVARRKIVFVSQERLRQAGTTAYDLDTPVALAVPIFAAPAAVPSQQQQQQQQEEAGGSVEAAAPTQALGALCLGFASQAEMTKAHARALLLLGRALGPLLEGPAHRCLALAEVVLGYSNPEHPSTPQRAASLSEGSALGSGSMSEEGAEEGGQWETEGEEEEEEWEAGVVGGKWEAGACGERGAGPPDDPAAAAGSLLAGSGGGREGDAEGSMHRTSPSATGVVQLPAETSSSAAAAAAVAGLGPAPAAEAPTTAHLQAGSSDSSGGGGGTEAAAAAKAVQPGVSFWEEEGSGSDGEGKAARRSAAAAAAAAVGGAAAAPPGVSRLSLRFADPVLESEFRRWHYSCLVKLDAASLLLMVATHIILCLVNPEWNYAVRPHWPLGLVPVAPLALLLINQRSYISWREELLLALNAYVCLWQFASAWPGAGGAQVSPLPAPAGAPAGAAPLLCAESMLPALALKTLYLDGFMWLLIMAVALQMRWSVHAPAQLLNFLAASMLFPLACEAKLGRAGGGAAGAAGGQGSCSAAGGAGWRSAVWDPQLRGCLLGLSAKVLLLAVLLPLLALRKLEAGARSIFLSHHLRAARSVQQTVGGQ